MHVHTLEEHADSVEFVQDDRYFRRVWLFSSASLLSQCRTSFMGLNSTKRDQQQSPHYSQYSHSDHDSAHSHSEVFCVSVLEASYSRSDWLDYQYLLLPGLVRGFS